MKILSADQIRHADAFTIKNEPIASIDLMERACEAFVSWFENRFDRKQTINVIAGPGNNGGDGLGIARLLLKKGYYVQAYAVRTGKRTSADFAINFERLSQIKEIYEIKASHDIPAFEPKDLIIDAIFGSGLSKQVEGLFAEVIAAINKSHATVIAVDIASGLFVDKPSIEEAIIKADYTISFQLPKLAFLLPQNTSYVGEWTIVDIGLSRSFIEKASTSYYTLEGGFVKKLIKKRDKFAHKGTFGRALLVAGSMGKMGAAVLSGKACLRAGVGLLTSHIPRCGYTIMQTAVPEAMVSVDASTNYISAIPAFNTYQAVGIGPGIDRKQETANALKNILSESTQPLILDADALNILADHKELIPSLPPHSILTPHIKEFERIAGKIPDDFQRIQLQIDFSQKFNVFVILKGAYTSISTPEGLIYFNTTGNPGMATAGSGDVLTGIATGLLAQGHSSLNTSILAVYIHGSAGDLAAEQKGYEALIASDIIDHLPIAFKKLKY